MPNIYNIDKETVRNKPSVNYLNKDFNNVLQCGNLNDTILESNGVFNPTHYIILNYKNGSPYFTT